jgi:hypothetical protein
MENRLDLPPVKLEDRTAQEWSGKESEQGPSVQIISKYSLLLMSNDPTKQSNQTKYMR